MFMYGIWSGLICLPVYWWCWCSCCELNSWTNFKISQCQVLLLITESVKCLLWLDIADQLDLRQRVWEKQHVFLSVTQHEKRGSHQWNSNSGTDGPSSQILLQSVHNQCTNRSTWSMVPQWKTQCKQWKFSKIIKHRIVSLDWMNSEGHWQAQQVYSNAVTDHVSFLTLFDTSIAPQDYRWFYRSATDAWAEVVQWHRPHTDYISKREMTDSLAFVTLSPHLLRIPGKASVGQYRFSFHGSCFSHIVSRPWASSALLMPSRWYTTSL